METERKVYFSMGKTISLSFSNNCTTREIEFHFIPHSISLVGTEFTKPYHLTVFLSHNLSFTGLRNHTSSGD
jgi:hypothetical protein